MRSLDLSYNQLTILPPDIGLLINLKALYLNINKLIMLPPEIGNLTNLKVLDLSYNKLSTLPPKIGSLFSLEYLELTSNKFMALPPEIGQLNNLQSLNLNHNEITMLPAEIGQLASLQSLDLNHNEITMLPAEIGQLTSLQSLDLSNNPLIALPLEIGQLTSLVSLISIISKKEDVEFTRDIRSGEVTLASNINDLLKGNLSTIPQEIRQLTNLQSLDLNNNQLTTLPPEIGQLANLRSLDLGSNQLATLPVALRHLPKLEKLHLYQNPLPLPPELLGDQRNPGNPQTILDAYFQASRPLREAKLLVVGEGSVGKTSLVERLLRNHPPSGKGKTVGVDIHRWECGVRNADFGLEEDAAIKVNIWDFGGQEIYHATHQFFLTHRSLYLVVLEARKDEAANRLDYWLRHVSSFAGDAPVILVVNKSDQGTLTLDERGLMLKYPAIRAIVHTSCTTGAGIDALRRAIESALAALPHLNDWIPLTWYAVKEELTARAQAKDYLPYESYVDLCRDEGIEHEAAQRTLARFLHDLGAVLNFQDDPRLAGTHVLNPEWVTDGIYHILNAEALQGVGILRLHDLDAILDRARYPSHKHPFLLDIMRKFELCVALEDGQRYLIPGLLPKERPAFPWPETASAALEYRYAILPAVVLTRLMVRLNRHTWQCDGQPIRWRSGLVLARDGCRALVVADPAAARLTIALDGPAPHRRHLLAVIRAELDEIHASFAKLEAEEWVPLGKPGAAIPYRALLNLEARGITHYYDPTHDVELDVRQLLDGIDSPAERDARALAQRLGQQFSLPELRQLCFELQVEHDNLPFETKTELARELTLHLQRRGRLPELEALLRRERPGLM